MCPVAVNRLGWLEFESDLSPAEWHIRWSLLAWALAKGYAAIPSSTKRENLASNLQAQHITLSDEQMAQIDQLEANSREVDPEGLAPIWD